MSFQYPDRITVQEVADQEVTAEHAVLEVLVESESHTFNREAVKKSRELGAFVIGLEQVGLSAENMGLEGVSLQTSTGKILKSTSEGFRVRVDKVPLDKVPAVLDVAAAQKNIEVEALTYEFGDLRDEKRSLLRDACSAAKEQGKEMGSAFGVPILGIYSVSPKWTEPSAKRWATNPRHGMKHEHALRALPRSLDGIDLIVGHKGQLELELTVEFRVGELGSEGPAGGSVK